MRSGSHRSRHDSHSTRRARTRRRSRDRSPTRRSARILKQLQRQIFEQREVAPHRVGLELDDLLEIEAGAESTRRLRATAPGYPSSFELIAQRAHQRTAERVLASATHDDFDHFTSRGSPEQFLSRLLADGDDRGVLELTFDRERVEALADLFEPSDGARTSYCLWTSRAITEDTGKRPIPAWPNTFKSALSSNSPMTRGWMPCARKPLVERAASVVFSVGRMTGAPPSDRGNPRRCADASSARAAEDDAALAEQMAECPERGSKD